MGWFGKHLFKYSGAGFGKSTPGMRYPGSGIGVSYQPQAQAHPHARSEPLVTRSPVNALIVRINRVVNTNPASMRLRGPSNLRRAAAKPYLPAATRRTRDSTQVRGQASYEPRGRKPRSVPRLSESTTGLWGKVTVALGTVTSLHISTRHLSRSIQFQARIFNEEDGAEPMLRRSHASAISRDRRCFLIRSLGVSSNRSINL